MVFRAEAGWHKCREPLPYKEFMRGLPDDITPEEAQKEFQAYLVQWWGSQVPAHAVLSLGFRGASKMKPVGKTPTMLAHLCCVWVHMIAANAAPALSCWDT